MGYAERMDLRRRWIDAVLWLGHVHRRLLAAYFAVSGPGVAYAVSGWLGRRLYRLLPPLRRRSEAQCRAALAGRVRPQDVPAIAEAGFVHRIWSLTDLPLAQRLLHKNTWWRYGGRVPQPWLAELRAAQGRRQPAILLTAYYGPFDLLPVFLGFNGIRAAVVYRRHPNARFDVYRQRVRARGGCELVPVEEAVTRLPRVLEAGGTIAVIADHHAERRGLPATFLGLPTTAVPTVGLLAWRYDADVTVAGIRRVKAAFCFEIVVVDVIRHAEWAGCPDPVATVTRRYLRGLERLVLADPTQYSWGYARWGEELAARLAADEPPARAGERNDRPSGTHSDSSVRRG